MAIFDTFFSFYIHRLCCTFFFRSLPLRGSIVSRVFLFLIVVGGWVSGRMCMYERTDENME